MEAITVECLGIAFQFEDFTDPGADFRSNSPKHFYLSLRYNKDITNPPSFPHLTFHATQAPPAFSHRHTTLWTPPLPAPRPRHHGTPISYPSSLAPPSRRLQQPFRRLNFPPPHRPPPSARHVTLHHHRPPPRPSPLPALPSARHLQFRLLPCRPLSLSFYLSTPSSFLRPTIPSPSSPPLSIRPP